MTTLAFDLDILAKEDVHSMAEGLLFETTEELIAERARLDAEITRRIQAVDARDVSVGYCGRTTASWMIEELHWAPGEAKTRVWAARHLPEHPELFEALADGKITFRHVTDILGGLRSLPGHCRADTEAEFIGFAKEHDPATLGALIRQARILTGADETAEAAAERKYRSRWASCSTTFDGMFHLQGMFTPEAGAKIEAALNALMTKGGEEDFRDTRQRRADALETLAQFGLEYGDLPDHGGERPHAMVITPLDELRNGLEAHQLGSSTVNGHPISANTARMLACDSGIIPIVMNGKGEVLDLGRSQRTWTTAQRRAARLRDNGCAFPECQAAIEHCDLHHLTFWARLGTTNLANSAHLCHFHHWLVHHKNWNIWRDHDGNIQVCRT